AFTRAIAQLYPLPLLHEPRAYGALHCAAPHRRARTMNHRFDRPPDRRNVPGEKWGRYAGRDVLPLWVADMDFTAPEPVLAALRARIDHGIFGYTEPWPGLVTAVIDGIARDHGWGIEADWLVWLP